MKKLFQQKTFDSLYEQFGYARCYYDFNLGASIIRNPYPINTRERAGWKRAVSNIAKNIPKESI